MIEIIKGPWPWYVSGPLIGLFVPALLLLGNKSLGISSSLRHFCAACMPAHIPYFNYNWRREVWNLFFVLGIVVGGMLASQILSHHVPVQIQPVTTIALQNFGFTDFTGMMPSELFGIEQILTWKGFVFLVIGGFLVGFGTRYAGGCTSGHTIMGLSNLQWPSLVASLSFMGGGFFSTHLLMPLIFKVIEP